ncbi:flavodoxin family protein [Burkholderia multivorans]|uniref:FMN-dependent NADH-azoreductase n=1 Tax=Burkholderia multivorans TaxID=87883 RepID=UPI000DAC9EC8|nr:NAD(P)H-dependent oxidoreductase [Burkholderia multivorans]MBR7896593.1 NAD(P)H-dependent oxidoreductase [Burkholderia multivorans]RAA28830.1 flavodoxin family protein [Burkholderia multivorans]RAA31683.1 flavodoxin family protein [Burkholderia multivorans]RAA38250.1 flavodoxin family protein [Burkholderia multivorans]RAA44422.1 flavodoxin family protein [Burkholderia multivorans]
MNILHIDFSPRAESYSRRLSAAIVAKLLEISPGASISRRDFGAVPLPHATSGYATALSTPATLANPPQAALALSETLIRDVEGADVIAIGTPMNNFTIPSGFKTWIDHVLRVGRTMKSTPTGKIGLLRDRPVFVGIAAGGVFSGERANQPDFLTPYLSAAFGCIGLSSLQFLPVQGTAFLSPDQTASAIERALTAIDVSVIRAAVSGQ